jgi:hypothetical protein
MMFCETGFLSLGGGLVLVLYEVLEISLTIVSRDGRYGLWMDSGLEKGVSSHCQTFGNEPLSDEGEKFDVLGVEVWYVGS